MFLFIAKNYVYDQAHSVYKNNCAGSIYPCYVNKEARKTLSKTGKQSIPIGAFLRKYSQSENTSLLIFYALCSYRFQHFIPRI